MDTAIALDRCARIGRPRGGACETSLPAGPSSPALWQMLRFMRRPGDFLLDCHQRFGDTFDVNWLGGNRHVLFAGPRAIQQIFAAPEDVLSAVGEYATFLPFLSRRSTMRCDRSSHRRQKRAIAQLFDDAQTQSHVEQAARCAGEMARCWPDGRKFVVNRSVERLAADLALEMVFGEAGEEAAALKADLVRSTRTYGPLLIACRGFGIPWARIGPWSAFDRIVRGADALRASVAASEGCIAARYADMARRTGIEASSVAADLSMITMASYIAISTRVRQAIQVLAGEEEVQDRLAAEQATAEEARRPFLDATLDELLRLYPNNPIVPRRVMQDMVIDGQSVRHGDTVGVCIFLAHRRAEAFADPHEFRPQRFLDRQYSSLEYLPFGGGARRCPAASFAPRLLKAIIAAIVTNCRLRRAEARANPPSMQGIHMGLSRPVQVVSQRRPGCPGGNDQEIPTRPITTGNLP